MGILFKPAPEVEQPTYEIVGPVERFDMQDKGTSRMRLTPGSPEYEEFYASKPQFSKEYDEELKRLKVQSHEFNWKRDPINEQLLPAFFGTMGIFGSPSIVEGNYLDAPGGGRHQAQNERPWNVPFGGSDKDMKIDPDEMAHKIKELGKYLGAVKVRITKLKQQWVYSHYCIRFGPGFFRKPVDDLDYENVICIAVQHDLQMKKIGRGAAEETEDGLRYSLAAWMSVVIAEFIRCVGYRARALPASNAPYFVIPTFIDAGMGEQGRHSFVVSKDIGCHWRPAAVATDLPLAIDKPVDFGLQDFCEKCTICADYCPSGTISKGGKGVKRGVRRWVIDSNKCKHYNETLGHSCGICQAVCPWNHPSSLLHDGVRELSQRFPLLRSSIVRAEKLFYPYTPAKAPDWMTSPGYFKEA